MDMSSIRARLKKEIVLDFLVSSGTLLDPNKRTDIVNNLEKAIDAKIEKFNLFSPVDLYSENSTDTMRILKHHDHKKDTGNEDEEIKKFRKGSFIGTNKPCEKCHRKKPHAKVKLGELHLFMCKSCIESTQKRFEIEAAPPESTFVFQLCFEPINQHLDPHVFICRDREEMEEWAKIFNQAEKKTVPNHKNQADLDPDVFYVQGYKTGWLKKGDNRVWLVYDVNNRVLYWDKKWRTLDRKNDGLLKNFNHHLILMWYKIIPNTLRLTKKTKSSRSFFKKTPQRLRAATAGSEDTNSPNFSRPVLVQSTSFRDEAGGRRRAKSVFYPKQNNCEIDQDDLDLFDTNLPFQAPLPLQPPKQPSPQLTQQLPPPPPDPVFNNRASNRSSCISNNNEEINLGEEPAVPLVQSQLNPLNSAAILYDTNDILNPVLNSASAFPGYCTVSKLINNGEVPPKPKKKPSHVYTFMPSEED